MSYREPKRKNHARKGTKIQSSCPESDGNIETVSTSKKQFPSTHCNPKNRQDSRLVWAARTRHKIRSKGENKKNLYSCAHCSFVSFGCKKSLRKHLQSHVPEHQLGLSSFIRDSTVKKSDEGFLSKLDSEKVPTDLMHEKLTKSPLLPYDSDNITFGSYLEGSCDISLSPNKPAESLKEAIPQRISESPLVPHDSGKLSPNSKPEKHIKESSHFNDPIKVLLKTPSTKQAENPSFAHSSMPSCSYSFAKFPAECIEKYASVPVLKHQLRCKYCFINFDQYSDFKVHMKSHPSDGLLSCALCPYKSTYQCNLEDHVLNNHSCANILLCM